MSDAAEAPLSQFSGSDFGARLERAVGELANGASLACLEALEEQAERESAGPALAAAYVTLVGGELLERLPARLRLEVLLKAAWCCGQHDAEQAVTLGAATRALEISPTDERALAIAEPLWLEAEQYGELAKRYAVAATTAGSEDRARQLLDRAIHMLGAIRAGAAAAAVLDLHERQAQLRALRDTDEALLAMLRGGGRDGTAALLKLGERWLSQGRAREGVAQLPSDLSGFQSEPALDLLERLFDQAEELERLEQLLRRRVVLEKAALGRGRALEKLAHFEQDARRDTEAALAALFAAAEAYTQAGERDDAERAYQRLLELAPAHADAASRLVTLRAQAGDFAGVSAAFGVVLRASEDARAASELLLSIARDAERASAAEEFAELTDDVLWRLSSDERELTERLLRESAALFAAQARYDQAAELYRRLIADRATSRDRDAYQALIDAHPASEWRRSHQRWLFEWQEHHTSDKPAVLLNWARFEEHEQGDPRAALNVLERARELAPERAEIWDDLLRLRLGVGDGAGAIAAAEGLGRLGRDLEPALLGLLLEQEPTARFAFDRLKITLSTEERWTELFELYERAIAAAADAPARALWLDEAAVAARDVAQDRERAVRYWEAHTELVPNDARVDLALERLYEQAGDRDALSHHLQRRLSRCNDEQRAGLQRRLTGLWLESGALAEALATIEALSQSGAPTGGLLEQLFGRAVELHGRPGAREAGRRTAELLRQHYEAEKKPQEVARLLRAELGLPLEPRERQELLGALSRLCERELDDLAGAFDAERQLFELTLAERERKRLEKLAKKQSRWAELGEVYADVADSELTADARRAYLRRSAELAESQLADPALATLRYQKWLEVEPERAVELFDAAQGEGKAGPIVFDALCQVLARGARFLELEGVLVRACEADGNPTSFSRLGRLRADALGDIGGAIAAHLSANDARAAGETFLRQPSVFRGDAEPAIDLATRLSQCGLAEGALRVLRHQLAFYEQHYTTERQRVTLALVRTLRELGQREEASQELAEAAKHFPTDAEVQQASAEDAVARQDFGKAEQCYRALLLLLHGANAGAGALRRASIYVELAAIKRRRGDDAAARELLESGFEIALGNVAELSALVGSLTAHEQWEAAERATLALLELEGDDLRSTASALVSIQALSEHSRSISPQLLAGAQRFAARAAARYQEVPEAPERSALLAACVALLPLTDARQLLASAEPQLPPGDALPARLALARRLLELGTVEARDEALVRLKALTSHPDAPSTTWQLLARAREESGDPTALREVLDAWLEREPQNVALLTRSLTNAVAGRDVERALVLYDRLLQLGATLPAEPARALCQLCLESGQTTRAVELLYAESARETKPAKRAALLLEAAELRLAANDGDGARVAAQDARDLDPTSADAVWVLAQLSLRRERSDDALALVTAHLESKERRRTKPLARVLRLAADLHLQRDQLGEALPLLVEAHQLDKTDLDTALLLGLLAIDLDRLETAASALRVLVAQRELGTREGARALPLNLAEGYFQLARIEQHHGKKTNAKRMALRALEEDPGLDQARALLNQLALH